VKVTRSRCPSYTAQLRRFDTRIALGAATGSETFTVRVVYPAQRQ
jgi:hypothetical protein